MKVTDAQKGASINKVAGITLENIEIETADDAYLQVENATDIVIDGKAYDKISEGDCSRGLNLDITSCW